MLHLRCFTERDVALGMRLKQQAGWNQTAADWRRFLALAPEGCFVAEWQGAPAGTAVAVRFGPVGWIGMVLVDPAVRGRGIGKALMAHAIAALDARGVHTVRLDATTLGQPLYRKLGFADQFDLARFARPAARPADNPTGPIDVDAAAVASSAELDAICVLDRAVTRTDRGDLLRRLAGEHPEHTLVLRQGEALYGYLMARPGTAATQIGPVIAEDAGAGRTLIAAALSRLGDAAAFIDVPLHHAPLIEWLTARGFAEQRRFKRMLRGQPLMEDLSRLIVSSGPEKG